MLFSGVILPVDSLLVAKYVIFLRQSNAARSAFSTIFVAIKWLHSFIPGLSVLNCPLNDIFLTRLKESAMRDVRVVSARKEPIQKDVISLLIRSLPGDVKLTHMRNVVMPSLAYALLLRHDEIVHLNCFYIVSCAQGLKFYIPSSKTDVYRNGKTVFLAKQEGEISVYRILLNYMQKAGLSFGQNHFLFCPIAYDCVINKKLSYSSYAKILNDQLSGIGLDAGLYGTHSLRSGGATDLSTTVTRFELLTAGRWRDARSLASYVKISEERRFDMSTNLFLH